MTFKYIIKMLLSFTVENFKSIRDLQTLSLEARSDTHLEESHVISDGKNRVLKTLAVFGPNASGKTNLIQAIAWLRTFVFKSSTEGQVGKPIEVDPFRLCTSTEDAPSHFEVEFFANETFYRYGFDVTKKAVQAEWLFCRREGSSKPAKLFTRIGQKFTISSSLYKEGKGLEERTRVNALFLSVCGQWNGSIATEVIKWIERLRPVSGLSEIGYFGFTANQLQDVRNQESLLRLAQTADLNIAGLRSEINADSIIKTAHQKHDADGKDVGLVEFDLRDDESEGTQKFIALAGPIFHTLEEGSILLVDELEARLHPLLTQALVSLFHSPANRKNSQLIFTTQDVLLMEPTLLRRDQIWYCEKDAQGATNLYSLADFDANQVRPTSKFSRQYLLGVFGAVPKLAHFEQAAIHATQE